MNEISEAHIQKARDRLRAAQLLLREEEAEDCISRAYYAVYHAAMAVLQAVDEAPKTHGGTQTRFWLRFVTPGYFPRSVAETFSQAQEMRQKADYDAFTRFDTNAASDLLRDAVAFTDEAEILGEKISSGELSIPGK